MSAVSTASAALLAALKAVPATRAYRLTDAVVDPPALILGPPSLTWDGYCSDPTSASFTVTVVVQNDDRALERLLDLLPLVTVAVDEVQDAVVTRAEPGSFSVGSSDLPAYLLTVEMNP